MSLIRIPKAFYDDHVDRELPAPPILRETSRHFIVDSSHGDFDELMSDARHYADDGTDADRWVITAARALLKAAAKAGQDVKPAAPRGP